MKVIETEAIVLRTMDFKERDCILTFLTKDHGKKAGILFGGKSIRSGNAAKSELFVRHHLEFSEKNNSDLVRIRKCDLLESYPPLRQDYSRFLHATYLADLLLQSEIPAEGSIDIFSLLQHTLTMMSSIKNYTEVKFTFELQLLKLFGIMPNLEACMQCGQKLWMQKHGSRPVPRFSSACQMDSTLGGMRCPDCNIRSNNTAKLHPGSLVFLLAMQNYDVNSAKIRPTQNNLKELDQAFYVYFRHYFGRDLKSHNLLKENIWKK